MAQGYEELRGILSDAELRELAHSHNIPFHVILRLTEIANTASKVRLMSTAAHKLFGH